MAMDDACELLCLDLPHAERIRAALPDTTRVEPAAAMARGLGESTRLRIASALLQGAELCVCDTAWVVGASQALVSHHLRQLRTAGIVTSRRDGRMVMYQLSDRGRAVLSLLLDTAVDTATDTAGDGNALLEGADRAASSEVV